MEQEQELAIIRRAYAKQIFLARAISPVAIVPCDGARDETSDAALAEAFKKGDCKRATRLYGMRIYPTTVVGFVPQVGASLTIDGVP
jgi:hypothetical protein